MIDGDQKLAQKPKNAFKLFPNKDKWHEHVP